jgi:outer membrane protein TolC
MTLLIHSAIAVLLSAGAQDTLRLAALQQYAVERDPRTRQFAIQSTATELRLRNAAAERLPRLTLRGDVARQSEVTEFPIVVPGGARPPSPPKDRYQAILDAGQLVYDGGVIARRQQLERARLAESEATLRTELFALRTEVNEAFFGALLLQERVAQLDQLVMDLEARHAFVAGRVEEGAALRSQAAELEVELLRAQQQRLDAAAEQRTALSVLASLTGRAISNVDVLTLPELPSVATIDARVRARPEYERFTRTRDRLQREADVRAAQRRPRVSAIGQLGYGRPGFDQFTRDVHGFWLAGVRVDWDVWDWRTNERDREVIALQQEIVQTEEAAFSERIHRATRDDVEDMRRLQAAIPTDERIVELRTRIEREAQHRLEEGVMNAADYVDARTDIYEARVALAARRVELARSRARYLTTLGLGLQ